MSTKHHVKYLLLVWFNRFRHSPTYKNKNMLNLVIIKWSLLFALLVCGLIIAPQMYVGFIIIFLVSIYATVALVSSYTEHQIHLGLPRHVGCSLGSEKGDEVNTMRLHVLRVRERGVRP
jgi:hypothetical protein